ncbi:MAG: glycosyltransferase, partial [Candidatus Diapherotrites archaeon]|nr:glycosyltransferase [Candidatus Diapherotrites archaeon]
MAITKTRFLPKGTNVVAIIPAYNEAKYIKHTVKQLKKCQSSGLIQDIVVVSDGSTDKTAKIAKDAGAKVIELKKNKGKTI